MIIGGPGNISTSTIDSLLESGHELGLFSLPSNGVYTNLENTLTLFFGNREDTIQLERAIKTFKPEVIVDFCCFHPVHAKNIIPLIDENVSQYIFISTVDVYGFPLSQIPFKEKNDRRAPNCNYALHKLECEKIFQDTQLPITILRPAYSFGPSFFISFTSHSEGRHLITRLRNRMPVLLPGDGNTTIHVSSSFVTGQMIAHTVGSRKAIHNDYTIAHPTIMTHEEYLWLFANALGVKPLFEYIPKEYILSFHQRHSIESIFNVLTCFDLAFSVEKYLRDFPDFTWRMDLSRWAAHTIAINDSKNLFPEKSEPIFDDQLIQEWKLENGKGKRSNMIAQFG